MFSDWWDRSSTVKVCELQKRSGNEANLSPFLAFLITSEQLVRFYDSPTHPLLKLAGGKPSDHLPSLACFALSISQPSFPFLLHCTVASWLLLFQSCSIHINNFFFLLFTPQLNPQILIYFGLISLFSPPLGYKLVKRRKLALLPPGSEIIPV